MAAWSPVSAPAPLVLGVSVSASLVESMVPPPNEGAVGDRPTPLSGSFFDLPEVAAGAGGVGVRLMVAGGAAGAATGAAAAGAGAGTGGRIGGLTTGDGAGVPPAAADGELVALPVTGAAPVWAAAPLAPATCARAPDAHSAPKTTTALNIGFIGDPSLDAVRGRECPDSACRCQLFFTRGSRTPTRAPAATPELRWRLDELFAGWLITRAALFLSVSVHGGHR